MPLVLHFLNGDALESLFPSSIQGKKIVFRECLIEGPKSQRSLDLFFKDRANYLNQRYPENDISMENYHEFSKEIIGHLNNQEVQKIYLWFERDLFCQANLWFLVYLIHTLKTKTQVYWVNPSDKAAFAFSLLSASELEDLIPTAIPLSCDRIEFLSSLWLYYSEGKPSKLLAHLKSSEKLAPLILPAALAFSHMARSDQGTGLIQMIAKIIKEENVHDFGTAFKMFCKKHPEYGLGDLQFKGLYDKALADLK